MSEALVILTGGKSSRMGSDKSRLPFGDTSLLEYMIERFSPYFEHIYISAKKGDDYHSLNLSIPVIEDKINEIGPMGGIYSVLSSVNDDRVLFVSVDTPFADPQIAIKMLHLSREHSVSLIRRSSGKIESLFAIYTQDCMPALESCIREQNYALKNLHSKSNTQYVDESDLFSTTDGFFSDADVEKCFFNMNTRQDYYSALKRINLLGSNKEHTPILSFVARSGTGKTTYLEKLIPLLKQQGLRLAILKHDAHGFDIDYPGKDSYRFTQAGADHVILTSEKKTAAIIQHETTISVTQLLSYIEGVDLIITEGYKHEHQKKIELLRKGYHEAPVSDPADLIAIIADFDYKSDLPVFDLNKPDTLIPYITSYLSHNSDRFKNKTNC